MERRPIASVEHVREELRQLGYLDSGLDRFVLGGARTSSRLAASSRVALRVGLAGAPVFGAALALAAVALEPRLLREPDDLAVLAAYLVLAAGIATAAAAFVGGLVAGWIRRRPGSDLSRNVGAAVAVVGLAYFALWWRSHAAASPLALKVGAALLGVALSLVLGRFGSLAAVAVLAAGGAGDRLPQASLSRRHLLPLVVSAAVLVGGGVAAASYLVGGAPSEPPDFAVVPTGLRVRVVGVDGLEARMAAQMVERGEMPRLKALLETGAHGRLAAEPEVVPAIVWTTIATGRGPEAHGIVSTGARRLAGMQRPVVGESRFASALAGATDVLRITRPQPPTSVLRGVKAFWNVASEKGLRVGVVNWWATWPADSVNGYVVSDRAFFKLEKGGPPDHEVHPPAALEVLRPLLPPADEDAPRRLDRFHADAARALRADAPPDVEAVYLQGLDVFTTQQVGDAGTLDVAGLDARLESVREYHRFLDGLLGAMTDDLGPRDVLVLVGDPGRLPRRSGEPTEGLLVLAGAPVLHRELTGASERDLAPTVLHLAGLPVSRELEGRVLEDALTPEFRRAHPVRTVPAYGRRAATRPAESEFDHEILEQLRSLGYIQ